MKRNIKVLLSLLLVAALILSGCSGSKSVLDKNDPVTITIWHYYNGNQQSIFDELVKEFNETVGAEKGIVVEAVNQGGC